MSAPLPPDEPHELSEEDVRKAGCIFDEEGECHFCQSGPTWQVVDGGGCWTWRCKKHLAGCRLPNPGAPEDSPAAPAPMSEAQIAVYVHHEVITHLRDWAKTFERVRTDREASVRDRTDARRIGEYVEHWTEQLILANRAILRNDPAVMAHAPVIAVPGTMLPGARRKGGRG